MKFRFAHITAIATGLLTTIAGADPEDIASLLTVVGLGHYASLAVPAIGLAGAVIALSHGAGIKPTSPSTKALLVFLLVPTLMTLTACASIQGLLHDNTPAEKLVLRSATRHAIVDGHTLAGQKVRAAKVVAVASEIRGTFDLAATDLPNFVAMATAKIVALKLPPTDAADAQDVLGLISSYVQTQTCPPDAGNCQIPADVKVDVDTAIGWIIDAAMPYTTG